MSCIIPDQEVVKQTIIIRMQNAQCMGCEAEYNGGPTCDECGTEFHFIAMAYIDPARTHGALMEVIRRFVSESNLGQVTFLGHLTSAGEVTPMG